MARNDFSSEAASVISSLAGSSTFPPPSEPPSSSLDGEDAEVNGVGVVDVVDGVPDLITSSGFSGFPPPFNLAARFPSLPDRSRP